MVASSSGDGNLVRNFARTSSSVGGATPKPLSVLDVTRFLELFLTFFPPFLAPAKAAGTHVSGAKTVVASHVDDDMPRNMIRQTTTMLGRSLAITCLELLIFVMIPGCYSSKTVGLE